MCNREHLFFLLSGYKTNIIHSVFFLYIFSITFLFILLQSLHADTSSEVKGGGDRHINNGVFLRFGFDDFEVLRKFLNDVKNKATKNSVGYVVSIQL